MANFIPSKKEAKDFNKGNSFRGQDLSQGIQGDMVKAEDMNNLVEGLLYAQENSGTSGLFEIPYDLTDLQSGSEGVDFIINNIEKIKKGAYFTTISGQSITFDNIADYVNGIALIFQYGSISGDDEAITYTVGIQKITKMVTVTRDRINGGDLSIDPCLMVGFYAEDGIRIQGDYNLTANEENNGKILGVENGAWAMVDHIKYGIYDVMLADTKNSVMVYIRIAMFATPHTTAEFIKFANLREVVPYSVVIYDDDSGYYSNGYIGISGNRVVATANVQRGDGDTVEVNAYVELKSCEVIF